MDAVAHFGWYFKPLPSAGQTGMRQRITIEVADAEGVCTTMEKLGAAIERASAV